MSTDQNPLDKIKIGPFTFEYDATLGEVYIANGDENAAMLDCVTEQRWAEFVKAAADA